MTGNTDGAAQGETAKLSPWEQDYEGLTRYGDDNLSTRFMTAEYANALERKAQMAAVLVKALEIIANELTHDPGYAQLARDVAEDTARAALATDHDALLAEGAALGVEVQP